MTALHVLCCDPHASIDQVQSVIKAEPSAVAHRDITGKIPFQRFLLLRDLPDEVDDAESNDNNENGEEGVEERNLPSLISLLENGIESKDVDILFLLKNEYQDDLIISDDTTMLLPFMSAATMPECGLDAVHSLAMKKVELLQMESDLKKRRKIN